MPTVAETAERLGRALAAEHPDWEVGEVAEAGAGLNFQVFRVESAALGLLAVRVPHVRWIGDGNNVGLDAWDLLRQEGTLSEHVRNHGVPSPRVHDLRLGGAIDYLATDHVPDDGGPIDDASVGELVAAVHRVPPPAGPLVEQGLLDATDLVAGRLRHRLGLVRALTGGGLPEPDWAAIDRALAWRGESRLLHMDVRRVNLRAVERRVRAVFDWGNAVVADPALELARIAEFGGLTDGFLAGYGGGHAWESVPPATRAVFRLDTAVMLCVVFLHESEDAEQAPRQLDRARALLRELNG